ncbi:hypothetical protein ACFQ73_18370 [Amycolatopsis japonica]|uniref:hypothetical protein n=1 Tax=Amycolatopsis japonica TaxID=208439 RepID=UPI00367298FC
MAQKTGTAPDSYFEAQSHLRTWLIAVDRQWARIIQAAEEHVQKDPLRGIGYLDDVLKLRADTILFSFALNQLRSTAVLLGTYMPEDLASEVAHAVMVFDTSQPWVREARNVLAHFDEYVRGQGRRQKARTDGRLQVISNMKMANGGFSQGKVADFVLSIDIAPGSELIEVNVHKSTGDAIRMTRAIEDICLKANRLF